MKRTYENALRILEASRRPATRPTTVHGRIIQSHHHGKPTDHGQPDLRGTSSLAGMKEWLHALGHTDGNVEKLNVVHVAGTKGKGSTCAYMRSFLQEHGARTGFPRGVGLYTSPHLMCIRERIQIHDKPVTEGVFANYFFEAWDKLSSKNSSTSERTPRYLQLLALVAFHIFITERVEAVVLETHHGGEYDSTNFVTKPVATGITSIGLDHLAQLGPSIENIAWHKAGIFKQGRPAFSSPQESNVVGVLHARAKEKGAILNFIQPQVLEREIPSSVRVPVQRVNCGLAIAMTRAFLDHTKPSSLESLTRHDIEQGVQNFHWPGRFEIITEESIQWFLDGGHNELAMAQVAKWFASNVNALQSDMFSQSPAILIFSHFSEERDGLELLASLAKFLEEHGKTPDYVIFTTYRQSRNDTMKTDKIAHPRLEYPIGVLENYAEFWRARFPSAVVVMEEFIMEAVARAREFGKASANAQVLITGSLFLVGGALDLIRPIS